MQTFDYISPYGTPYSIFFIKQQYFNGNLNVEVYCREAANPDENDWEPYGTLTVNLPGFALSENQAFLDTNNVYNLCQYILEHGWATETGETSQSGFCTYPLAEFTDEFLNTICVTA